MNIFSLLSNAAASGRLFRMLVLIPNLYPLIDRAERVYRSHGEKRGVERKAFVLEAVRLTFERLQKRGFINEELAEGLEKTAAELIDVIVEVHNVMRTLKNDGPSPATHQ